MKKVFISGSMSIKKLDELVRNSLEKIIALNLQVLVGDAYGVDKLVQEYFYNQNYYNVTIYTIFDIPRNLVSNKFLIKKINTNGLKGRKAQEKKDETMTFESNYSFVIWDGKSKGSFNNILRAFENNKKLKIYYEKEKRFLEKKELNINNIKMIYYKYNGVGLRELAKYSNQSLAYIKEIVKHYPQFKIINHYQGKKQVKYSIELVDVLINQHLFGMLSKEKKVLHE
jgi:hypothetical protein